MAAATVIGGIGGVARRAALGAALLLAALAAACGGGDADATPTSAGSSAASGVRPAAALAPATPTAPARSAADAAQDIAIWAASMCAIQSQFAVVSDGIADGVDPTTLDLEERKLRYQRVGPAQSALYTETALALAQVQSPSGTREYHQAVLLQVQQLAAALQRQAELVAVAATTEEIDATNVELEQLRLRTRAEVNFATQAMPGPARAALLACGGATDLGAP